MPNRSLPYNSILMNWKQDKFLDCVHPRNQQQSSNGAKHQESHSGLEGRPRGNTDGSKTLSPLRYPGAKRHLIPLVRALLGEPSSPPGLFIEPFAGGTSVGIQLLADRSISRLIINDLDDLIFSFWQTAAFDSQWLIDTMWDLEITLGEWERMKGWQPSAPRDKALKCLFLNRTSFSGILNQKAGPIGGKRQQSKYPIHCRFCKATIQHRLKRIAALGSSGRIEAVWNHDWKDCIESAKGMARHPAEGLTFYLDPPFFAKAVNLYRHSFNEAQHALLSQCLQTLDASWILSYDDHPKIRDLYHSSHFPKQAVRQLSAEYRAASKTRKAIELIVTNLQARV